MKWVPGFLETLGVPVPSSAAAFAAETLKLGVWSRAAGHRKAGLAEAAQPACTPGHPGALGALGNIPEWPSPASLPTRGWLQPGPPVRRAQAPCKSCSCGPFPIGQLILD